MNNRKSPIKQQQRMKNSHSISVSNTNRMRSNSSMGSSYSKNLNRHYSHTTSPTASSLPAVPLFYSNVYADPPDCSALPKPPESWYLKSNDENLPVKIVEEKKKENSKPKPKQKSYYTNNNKGFYSPFYSRRTQTPYISVKA